jgi:hypothetical protein
MIPHDFVPEMKLKINRRARRRQMLEAMIGVLGAALLGTLIWLIMFLIYLIFG